MSQLSKEYLEKEKIASSEGNRETNERQATDTLEDRQVMLKVTPDISNTLHVMGTFLTQNHVDKENIPSMIDDKYLKDGKEPPGFKPLDFTRIHIPKEYIEALQKTPEELKGPILQIKDDIMLKDLFEKVQQDNDRVLNQKQIDALLYGHFGKVVEKHPWSEAIEEIIGSTCDGV